MRALPLIYSGTEFLGFRKPRLDSIPNRKGIRILKGLQKTRLSIDRRPTNAMVNCLQSRLGSFQSVDQAVDRFHAMVDRAVDRSTFVHLVHNGRPGGQPAACCMRRFSLLCLPISVLSSSISSISSLPIPSKLKIRVINI